MITWGVNALNHGSSLAIFNGNHLLNLITCKDDRLDSEVIYNAFSYGGPSRVYWYERPYLKKLRQLRAGQWSDAFDWSVIPRDYINHCGMRYAKMTYTPHHASHAAAGYYTSPFDHCAVVVLDAIGEFECASVWEGRGDRLTKLWTREYPHSLGLFYSAFTKLLGYQPILEEYRLQKDSELGDPSRYYNIVNSYFTGVLNINHNFHRGVQDWSDPITSDQDRYDIAAAVQRVFEEQVSLIMSMARSATGSDNLVYMGGCAMNSLANQRVVENKFDKIWSLPNPGDASSAVGSVLYHTKQRIKSNFGLVKHIDIRV